MNECYFKPTSYSRLNTFLNSFVDLDVLEDNKYIDNSEGNRRYHHNAHAEINLIGNDQINNNQITSSFVTDSNITNKRDNLENDYFTNNKFKDKGIYLKNIVKDSRIANMFVNDKNKIKDKNKDLKYELKGKIQHRKQDVKDKMKDHKDGSRDRSKHHNDELKDKSKDYKFKLKHKKENKYDLKDCIDHNSKIKRGYKINKCMLKDKNSTKDNDSKMRNDSSKSAKSESKYGGTDIVNSNSKKERKYKSDSPEIKPNAKKTITAVKPESSFELIMEKQEIITSGKERNINSGRRSNSRSCKRAKEIDETCTSTRRKDRLVSTDNSQKNNIRIVKKPWEISRKRIGNNPKQTGESVLTEVAYRRNHKFKPSPLSTANNYTDLTDIIGKAEMEIENDKIVKDTMNVEIDNKNDLLNSKNATYDCKEDNKKSFNPISVLDIYKMKNMIEYEMDMKKRFLKKLESNRTRTQISIFGNPSLPIEEHIERKDLSHPEEQCINGIIKYSNLSENETLKGNIHGSINDLRIQICEDTSALCKRLTNKMLIRSNFNKTREEKEPREFNKLVNIFDDCSEASQLKEKNKNNNILLSAFDRGNIQTNTYRTFNRGRKRVSFATQCGLICHNSTEKLVPLKNLKKIIHNLSNSKINKVGFNKKRNKLNKKTWQYSSKLLKLLRNKSITLGKDKHLYQSIKKKPKIGEKLDTRIKSNNLSWSFKNKLNLDRFLIKESPKPIKEKEICKNEFEIKETNSAYKQINTPLSLVEMIMNNMTLRGYDNNSSQLTQNICSTSNINKKKNQETACMLKNLNQINFGFKNDFHFPHKDDNLKRINDSGPINRRNLFPKFNIGNNENPSYLKFHHPDHNIGGSFPNSPYEVKTGSAYKNIKVELPEKETNYCFQSLLKPERQFLKEIKRNNFTNNNYLRRNNYLGENGKYLTYTAKNNQLLKQKRLWNRKNIGYSFGKKVNDNKYDPIHSRNIRRPDFICDLNKDCSDQILPNQTRNKVANSMKTLNNFLCEDKLKRNSACGENINPPKIIIKDSEKSLLEIKFSDKFSINVSGNEIKVEGFGNNDVLKGLTIVNNNFKKDNDVKTCPDTKQYTSVEKGMEIENQKCDNGKFNHNSKIIKESKTFVDKSSWTENDYVLHKVRGNNKDFTADKNGNKTENYSEKTRMIDVGTDCLPYNTISTSKKNMESKGPVPNYSSSNQQRNIKTNNTQQGRNDTFIEYNMPENNKLKNESTNILKTMKMIYNKEKYKKIKKDVGIQYDLGVTCIPNQIKKPTCMMTEKTPNFLNKGEEIKHRELSFRTVDENLETPISNRSTINNNIEESFNTDTNTDIFDFSALNISLPEQEILCEPILLSNLRKCDDLPAPNVSKKHKKSTKIEGSDRNIFTYLVKKIKTLINSVNGKLKLEMSTNLNQQSKSNTILGNASKIKSSISLTEIQNCRDNCNCFNCDRCKGNVNLEKRNDNCENELVEKENVEETNAKNELQLDKISNLKDFINDAVEKFLTTNLEFFPTNVGPIQISVKGGKNNFDNSNQLQNLNKFKKETIHRTFTNKNHNICLVSNKRIQNKNNLTFSPSTTMIKRFFCKDKQKKNEAEYELSQFKRVPPEELAVKTIVSENNYIVFPKKIM